MRYVFLKDVLPGRWALRAFLAICPALMIATTAINGLWLSAPVALVMVLSAICIALLRPLISDMLRLPTYLVVASAFAALAQMLMSAYFPAAAKPMGLYVSAVLAAALILMREADQPRGLGLGGAALHAALSGMGFALVATAVGALRELLGKGAVFGMAVFAGYEPANMVALLPGGFVLVGLLAGIVNHIVGRRSADKEGKRT